MSYKSLASRAKGHSSSSHSTVHFIRQRLSAFALIPLVIWFIAFCAGIIQSPTGDNITSSIACQFNVVCCILFISIFLYHGYLGMQIIMKDYIHSQAIYKFINGMLLFICIVTYVTGIINILYWHFIFRTIIGL